MRIIETRPNLQELSYARISVQKPLLRIRYDRSKDGQTALVSDIQSEIRFQRDQKLLESQ